jgi:hypothetical protein
VSEKTYRVTHAIAVHDPPLQSDEVPDGHGACDALFTASVSARDDGTSDIVFDSINGFSGERLPDSELFMLWCKLAQELSEVLPEGSGQQEICTSVTTVVRTAYRKAAEASGALTAIPNANGDARKDH